MKLQKSICLSVWSDAEKAWLLNFSRVAETVQKCFIILDPAHLEAVYVGERDREFEKGREREVDRLTDMTRPSHELWKYMVILSGILLQPGTQ